MTDIKLLVGKRIKELRKRKNMTQQKLAELINIDQRNMSAIECGINFPTKHILKISEALQMELVEFFDFGHLSISNSDKKKTILDALEILDQHDLDIVYRLVKSMN